MQMMSDDAPYHGEWMNPTHRLKPIVSSSPHDIRPDTKQTKTKKEKRERKATHKNIKKKKGKETGRSRGWLAQPPSGACQPARLAR